MMARAPPAADTIGSSLLHIRSYLICMINTITITISNK